MGHTNKINIKPFLEKGRTIGLFLLNHKRQYKKWSFIFLIVLVALNVLSFFIVVNRDSILNNHLHFYRALSIISAISNLFLASGIVLTTLFLLNKEHKDYQFFASILGYPLFLVLYLLAIIA